MTEPRHIPETHVVGKRLGRHVHHDEASRKFVAETAGQVIDVNHIATGLPLDQGQIGSCTANALCGALNSAPNFVPHSLPKRELDAIKLYQLETKMEGEPYPPNDPGGSGLMVCKAAKQLGWIKSYTHTFSTQTALLALVIRPVIAGVNWYSSFDRPDPKTGVVSIAKNATVRGGHEVVALEIRERDELVGFENSWGHSFGQGGRFYMSFDTLDRLLREQGDITVPIV